MLVCLDFLNLNNVTKNDIYQLQRIDDNLDRFRHANIFLLMDLQSNCWQIVVAERDREKTPVGAPDGL